MNWSELKTQVDAQCAALAGLDPCVLDSKGMCVTVGAVRMERGFLPTLILSTHNADGNVETIEKLRKEIPGRAAKVLDAMARLRWEIRNVAAMAQVKEADLIRTFVDAEIQNREAIHELESDPTSMQGREKAERKNRTRRHAA